MDMIRLNQRAVNIDDLSLEGLELIMGYAELGDFESSSTLRERRSIEMARQWIAETFKLFEVSCGKE